MALDKNYDPRNYEKEILDSWTSLRVFNAEHPSEKESFVILMPPPNVTSQLHMGHGTGYTFQDLLVRWKRMLGFNALWLPGTDHAGIATQMMVEKDLMTREKKTRFDLGREDFFKLCQDWRDNYGEKIYEQFGRIGFSADYERKAYTLDPDLSAAVQWTFVDLYKSGLIYRGERLINWDPVLKTAISDDEIYNQEEAGFLYYIAYKILGDEQASITVATTRPETLLGDVAIAVHPEDDRYKALIGKEAEVPLSKRRISIIADDYVKPEFGTGALKITPAHDFNDFEIGKRHSLKSISILDENACLIHDDQLVPREFQGLSRERARKEILLALSTALIKTDNHTLAVPRSDRSKSIIEPRISTQWFVKMQDLAAPALALATNNEIHFYPENLKKTYVHWLGNIQDWCISRQLWWGHRIPAYHCQACSHITVAQGIVDRCESCHSTDVKQDEDVLDTWFSSWLWPLSPFGWPDPEKMKQKGFDTFYPSSVLVTGSEIIFLWVARMIMAGLRYTGKPPFKDIYFNAIVTDPQGRKFSKTLGNGIDPIEVIEEFGADAVRFTAVSMAPIGGRIAMEKADFQRGSKFVNKVYHAARFLNDYLQGEALVSLKNQSLPVESEWLLHAVSKTAGSVNSLLEQYRLNEATNAIYHLFWDDFCGWGLEIAKVINPKDKDLFTSTLLYSFDQILRLLSPIVPFITEALWREIPRHPDLDSPKSLCLAQYPLYNPQHEFPESYQRLRQLYAVMTEVRSSKQKLGLTMKEECTLEITAEPGLLSLLESKGSYLQRFCGVHRLNEKDAVRTQAITIVGDGFSGRLLVKAADTHADRDRLTKERARLEGLIKGIDSKLANASFTDRAPADVVEGAKKQRQNLMDQLQVVLVDLGG